MTDTPPGKAMGAFVRRVAALTDGARLLQILTSSSARARIFDMAEPDQQLIVTLLTTLRREMREMNVGLRDVHEQVRRLSARVDGRFVDLERSLIDIRGEIETTIRVEVGGRMAGAETRMDERLEDALLRMEAQLGVGGLGTMTADDKPD